MLVFKTRISSIGPIIKQIWIARVQWLWKDHPVKLSRWSSKLKQRRGTGPWQRTRHSGERRTRSSSWLHATRTCLVQRLHHQRDAPILWSHLQFAVHLCRLAVRISDQIATFASERTLRQDAEWRPAAARFVCRRIVSRARIAHLGRTNCWRWSFTSTQVTMQEC